MLRLGFASFLALFLAATATGHFPFILPENGGSAAKVVFSDDLTPDTKVNIEKIAGTKLSLRDATGKETKLDWKKEEGFYTVMVPGSGNRTIYGVTDYGVLQKGDTKPFKLVYYPKAILGDFSSKGLGDKVALEIVASSSFGKIKFQVMSAGKPLPEIEVSVFQPKSGKKEVKTDKDGFTPEFGESGRYGVVAKWFEAKSGDFGGKKYEEIRNYATLVCDYEK